MKLNVLFLLAVTLLLTACASYRKQAQSLSEKGLHEEAIPFWEKALEDDKEDEEALLGLKTSQAAVMNDRLVRIRDLRNSGSYAQALASLKELVGLQTKWKAQVDYNSSIFQGQETLSLWKYHHNQLNLLLEKNQPLAAAAHLAEYKEIFAHHRSTEQGIHHKNIMKVGKVQCRNLLTEVRDTPYYESFVRQYCSYFGGPSEHAPVKLNETLISQVIPLIEISGVETTDADVFTTRLQSSLTQSPWYSIDGKKSLPIRLTGQFLSQSRKRAVELAHEYLVKEPYTAYEKVKVKTVDPVSGVKKTTKESRPVTKYREVTKVYRYQGVKKSQTITLKVSSEFEILGKKHRFEWSKTDNEDAIAHDQNLPRIGLAPARGELSNPVDKLKNYAEEIAKQFQQKTVEVWTQSYCVLPATRKSALVAENVMRCRKVYGEKNKQFVDQWFKNKFGVDSLVAERTLGSF